MSGQISSLEAKRRRGLAFYVFFAMYLVTLAWIVYFCRRHDLVASLLLFAAAMCFVYCAIKALGKGDIA